MILYCAILGNTDSRFFRTGVRRLVEEKGGRRNREVEIDKKERVEKNPSKWKGIFFCPVLMHSIPYIVPGGLSWLTQGVRRPWPNFPAIVESPSPAKESTRP